MTIGICTGSLGAWEFLLFSKTKETPCLPNSLCQFLGVSPVGERRNNDAGGFARFGHHLHGDRAGALGPFFEHPFDVAAIGCNVASLVTQREEALVVGLVQALLE